MNFEYFIVTSTAFPLYYHRQRFHEFYRKRSDRIEKTDGENDVDGDKMKQLQLLCQLICVSVDVNDQHSTLYFSSYGVNYHILPFELSSGQSLYSCILTKDEPNHLHNFENMVSYFLLQKFLSATSEHLPSFLNDLTKFQDKTAKESTFNDSAGGDGGVYDEQYLEDLFIQYSLFDDLSHFEELYIKDSGPCEGLLEWLSSPSKSSITIVGIFWKHSGGIIPLLQAKSKVIFSSINLLWSINIEGGVTKSLEQSINTQDEERIHHYDDHTAGLLARVADYNLIIEYTIKLANDQTNDLSILQKCQESKAELLKFFP